MRIGTGDEFLRTTGGTLTGQLVVSVNHAQPLIVNRPDGTGMYMVSGQIAGVDHIGLACNAVEPRFSIDEALVAQRMTVRKDTGLLGTGLLPLSMLKVDEKTGSNAGIVTVLAGATSIVSLAMANVAAGDRILVTGSAQFTKGATAGISAIFATQSAGNANVVGEANDPSPGDSLSHANGIALVLRTATIMRVTVGGTLTLDLQGTSAGSNSTVAAGTGQFIAQVLRG